MSTTKSMASSQILQVRRAYLHSWMGHRFSDVLAYVTSISAS